MTGQPVLGDFLLAARQNLEQVTVAAATPAPGRDAEEITASFRRVITALAGYAADLTITFGELPEQHLTSLRAFARAAVQTRDALASAAASLRVAGPAGRPASVQARQFADAAAVLRTGRDLLQTHFASDRAGARRVRSRWGLVICSPPVSRALLEQITALSGQAAAAGRAALSDAWSGQATELGRRLQLACQWLTIASTAGPACQLEPVTAAERDLLAAIPGSALPPHRLPDGTETVPGLCAGIVAASQRVSHLAWAAASTPPGSPAICVQSWRRIASAGTATSHHVHLLLTGLAARAPDHQLPAAASETLGHAAARARQSRTAWLQTGRALGHVTTDVRWRISRTAAEAGDLALWTGRLAFASPHWVPADGPQHPVRPPQNLAPAPEDVPQIVAAVHYTAEALERLAACTGQQARQAACAQRVLLPAKLLPERSDNVRLFSPAPPDRITALLTTCHDATQATARTASTVSGVAASVRAPSLILTTATVAIRPSDRIVPGRAADPRHPADRNQAWPDPADTRPGPTETQLRDLGVTSPRLLWQASGIDHLTRQVIADATATLNTPEPGAPSRYPAAASQLSHSPAGPGLAREPSPAARAAQPGARSRAIAKRLSPLRPASDGGLGLTELACT